MLIATTHQLSDKKIELIASSGRLKIYGIGSHRAIVQPMPTGRRWLWKTWDVLQISVGGTGFSRDGVAKTMSEGMETALDILRKIYGIEQIAEGQ